METKDEAGGPVPLAPRPTGHPLVRILQKLGLRTLAWVGVYLLGYFDFSLGWMVTPLLLSVLRCPVITVSIVTILVIIVITLSSGITGRRRRETGWQLPGRLLSQMSRQCLKPGRGASYFG